ncbi:MAG: hypothetical protein LJE70_02455 [Chromatiaceae bacterium]|nr:hypothetical protein [Chromatiaceae bacterium]
MYPSLFFMNSISILFSLIAILHIAASPVWAAEGPSAESTETSAALAAPTAEQDRTPTHEERLETILQSIKSAEAERTDIKKRIKTAPSEAEKKELEEDVTRLTRRLEELRTSFEELATGGTNIAALEMEIEQMPVDWKQELEVIVRPLLQEVKRMTERPRRIERLRGEQAVYEDRLETADKAIASLDETIAQTRSDAVKQALSEHRKDWASHRVDVQSRLQLVNGQLERLLAPEASDGQEIVAALREFFSGRGLSALLAAAGFVVTYFLLASFAGLVERVLVRRRRTKTRRLAKAGGIFYRLFSLLAAILAAMAILYVRGDWLILGLLILFLFAVVLALRNSFPRYVDELRILLNLGGVREGERLLYNGIPWRIKSLNYYSILHNPLLRGGTIRVPISEMADLQSRRFADEEPWFASRENDFVILDGDVFGKVLLQTPEVVQLQVVGSTKTFTVADYLGQHPRNLSLGGFAIPLSFGLDYRHQCDILGTIVIRMREYLQEQLDQQLFRRYLKDFIVDFNEAASSSLNLIIVAAFDGGAAEQYWSIRRFLQRTAVDACNHYGWTIPFDQLSLHIPKRDIPLPEAGLAAPTPD